MSNRLALYTPWIGALELICVTAAGTRCAGLHTRSREYHLSLEPTHSPHKWFCHRLGIAGQCPYPGPVSHIPGGLSAALSNGGSVLASRLVTCRQVGEER